MPDCSPIDRARRLPDRRPLDLLHRQCRHEQRLHTSVAVATVTNAIYYVVARRVVRDVRPVPALGVLLAAVAVVFVTVGAATGNISLAYPPPALLAILGTGVLASLLAPLLLLAGLRSVSAVRAAMLGTLEPVITVVPSVLLLQDQLSLLRSAGMAMVIGGIALIQVRRPEI